MSSVFESRGTADPTLITELLMTLLEVHGERITPSSIQKRVRDDVCWATGAENPWRRSPFWMVIRVGLMRHLRILQGLEMGTLCYKILLCQFLSIFPAEGVDQLDPDVLKFLNAKVARRLTKLENTLCKHAPNIPIACKTMFKELEHGFLNMLDNSNASIATQWDSFKSRHQKRIRPLPRRADQSHLKLTLLNSRKYLQNVLSWGSDRSLPVLSIPLHQPPTLQASPTSSRQFQQFESHYWDLASLEREIELHFVSNVSPEDNPKAKCEALADSIRSYLKKALDAYSTDPEQKSIMILNVMDLWVSVDRCATEAFPLLLDYDPGIPAATLDVLLLMHRKDFVRLQRIQSYLHKRTTACKHGSMTIFNDPAPGSFAEQYFDHSTDSTKLRNLLAEIESEAEKARRKKLAEWQEKSTEYRSLQQEIRESSCIYTVEDDCKVHDDQRCRRCFLGRKAWRMQIEIHEHPLPAELVYRKAVMFEIGAPKAFRRYRDVTWQVSHPLYICAKGFP